MVWPFLLFLGLSQVACKPQGSRNATQNDHPTRLETCLNQLKGDTNQALEGFLNLDLAQGQLFSKGNPLSYSEAEFAKLDRESIDKMFPRLTSELTALKQMARAVKDRRDQAASSGDAAAARRWNAQLSQFGTRLQGPENLKLTQMVGQGIQRLAGE
jgi:hypothetical protein